MHGQDGRAKPPTSFPCLTSGSIGKRWHAPAPAPSCNPMPSIEKIIEEIIDTCRVPAGKSVRLKDYDPAWAGDKDIPKAERKATAQEHFTQDTAALAAAQELLYAADSWGVLVVFQAMDAAGKDSTIKHVMSG